MITLAGIALAFLALAGAYAATLWRATELAAADLREVRAARARTEAEIERRAQGRSVRRVPVGIETERGALRREAA